MDKKLKFLEKINLYVLEVSSRNKYIFSVSALILYIVIFIYFYHYIGVEITAIAGIFIILSGWMFGFWGGTVAGLIYLSVSAALFINFGSEDFNYILSRWPIWISGIILISISSGFQSLYKKIILQSEQLEKEKARLKKEIFERKSIEKKLHEIKVKFDKNLPGEEKTNETDSDLSYVNKILLEVLSSRNYKEIAENAVDIIYTVDLKGNFTYANAVALRNTGYTKEELYKLTYLDLIPEEYHPQVKGFYIRQYLNKEMSSYLEFPFVLKDGSVRWYGQNANLVFGENKITGFSIIARNITERKEAEIRLQQSEKDYRQLFLTAHDPIIVFNPNNEVVLEVNDRACEIYGFSRSEFIGMSLKSISKNKERGKQKVLETLELGKFINFETIQYKKDGTELYLEINASVTEYRGKKAILSINRDVTERKKSERLINLLAQAVETTSEIITITDYQDRFIFVNKTFLNVYDYTLEEVIGSTPALISSGKNPPELFESILRESRKDGWSGIVVNKKKNGDEIIISLNTSNIKDNEGNNLGLMGVARDITEELLAKEKLSESEERYRTMFDYSGAIMMILDPETGLIKGANNAACDYYGYSREEFLNTHIMNINTLPKQKVLSLLKEILHYRKRSFQFNHRLKNGELKNVEVYASSIRINNEQLIYSIIHDVTDRVKAETELEKYKEHLENLVEERTDKLKEAVQQLNEENRKLIKADLIIKNQINFFKTLLNTIPIPVFIKDKTKAYLDINKEFEKFFGITKEDIVGKEYYHDSLEVCSRLDDELLASAGDKAYEAKTVDNKGEIHNIIVYKAPFMKEGSVNGIVGVMLDITPQVKMQEEIQKSFEKERELNELKSRFISTVSHEFRTPLTSILASTELMIRYNTRWDNDKKLNVLERIQKSVMFLNNMITDVLTLNRADLGKMEYNPQPVDLLAVAETILEEIKIIAGPNHKLILKNNMHEIMGNFDEKLLRNIIQNLLSNAIKYSPDGGDIILEFAVGGSEVLIKIMDQGIGISQDDRHQLFTPFYRGQNIGNITGTGLGLSIIKRAVELHKGKIDFSSSPGKGTVFNLSLPLNL